MSLFVDENELVKQMKDQELLKDLSAGFYEYKLFGLVPVQALLVVLPVILILMRRK